jgi:hypothetical protein
MDIVKQMKIVIETSTHIPRRFSREDFNQASPMELSLTTSALTRSRLALSSALALSLNTKSICSRVFPFVSGIKKYVQANESKQNTAKKTYAPKPVFCTSGGVMRPWAKSAPKARGRWGTTYNDEVVQPV